MTNHPTDDLMQENARLISVIRHLDKTLERWHREGPARGRYALKNIRNEYASLLGISNETEDYQ